MAVKIKNNFLALNGFAGSQHHTVYLFCVKDRDVIPLLSGYKYYFSDLSMPRYSLNSGIGVESLTRSVI